MDDATIPVPEGYRDRTAHVLEWTLEDGEKLVLVVNRELLPPDGAAPPASGDHAGHSHGAPPSPRTTGEGTPFDRYVAAQTKVYPSQFAGFRLERDEVATGESPFEMRRKVFRWRHEQDVLYHHQVFVLLGDNVLGLTGSAKARNRDAVDRLVGEALAGLKVRGEDEDR
jgi:hypothetical protein